jgi:CRISPR/Cas system-associated exonuclease Cas4 (RecB family)|tara:strand:- start:741 stop:1463 length:723 start_codon:yes stop_codon:yes gene_type:complete
MINLLDKYSFPKTMRSSIEGKRHYEVTGEKLKLPSVTTILSATESKAKQQSLEAWRIRVGHANALKITTDAASRGTTMHAIVEGYLLKKPRLDLTANGEHAHKMANILIEKAIQGRLTDVYGIEPTLYKKGSYAGAADFIGLHDGIPIIGDWKQSNKPKREEWLRDTYRLQLAAYALAFEDMFGEPINKGVNFICTKDFLFQEIGWDGNDFAAAKDEWLKKVDQYYELQSKKTLIPPETL